MCKHPCRRSFPAHNPSISSRIARGGLNQSAGREPNARPTAIPGGLTARLHHASSMTSPYFRTSPRSPRLLLKTHTRTHTTYIHLTYPTLSSHTSLSLPHTPTSGTSRHLLTYLAQDCTYANRTQQDLPHWRQLRHLR
jgi:hypothetical protein